MPSRASKADYLNELYTVLKIPNPNVYPPPEQIRSAKEKAKAIAKARAKSAS